MVAMSIGAIVHRLFAPWVWVIIHSVIPTPPRMKREGHISPNRDAGKLLRSIDDDDPAVLHEVLVDPVLAQEGRDPVTQHVLPRLGGNRPQEPLDRVKMRNRRNVWEYLVEGGE